MGCMMRWSQEQYRGGRALGSPFPGDGSPPAGLSPSLWCDWNVTFPVNPGGFTIEDLSHLNGCW